MILGGSFVMGPHRAADEVLHRDHIKAVRTRLSDSVKRSMAAGAFEMLGLEHLLHDRQMGRQ